MGGAVCWHAFWSHEVKEALVEVAGGRVTGDGEEDETGKEGRPHND